MIRLLSINELPLLLEGGREFFAEGKIPGGFDEYHFVCSVGSFMRDGVCYVAGSFSPDGRIQGALAWMLHPGIFSPALCATELFWFVRDEFRGRISVGMGLLAFFENEARRRGAKRLAMIHMMNLQPEKLSKLYERRGYTLIEKHYEREAA